MAEKTKQRNVSITLDAERPTLIPVVFGVRFKLRLEKTTGLIDICIEDMCKKTHRIALDPVVLKTNLSSLKSYAASLSFESDDDAQNDDMTIPELATFANIMNFGQMNGRAETIFGVFRLMDWIQVSRGEKPNSNVDSMDVISVMSSAEFQKKILLELVVLMSS